MDDVINTASELLRRLNQALPAEATALADDLLLLLYRLKDEYTVVRSTSRSITGKSFVVLQNPIYNLESAPDATMSNPATVEFLRTLLEDLVRGNIVIRRQS